jgi:Ca2+-binding RTX toxin-like protein
MSEEQAANTLEAITGRAAVEKAIEKVAELSFERTVAFVGESLVSTIVDESSRLQAIRFIAERNVWQTMADQASNAASVATGTKKAALQLAAQGYRQAASTLEAQFLQQFAQTQTDFASGVLQVFGTLGKTGSELLGPLVGGFFLNQELSEALDDALVASNGDPNAAVTVITHSAGTFIAGQLTALQAGLGQFLETGVFTLSSGQTINVATKAARYLFAVGKASGSALILTATFEAAYQAGTWLYAQPYVNEGLADLIDGAMAALTQTSTSTRYPTDVGALALLTSYLDQDLTSDDLDAILQASANDFKNRRELNAFHGALRALLAPQLPPVSGTTSDQFVNEIVATLRSVKQTYEEDSFSIVKITDAASIQAAAAAAAGSGDDARAYRYALLQLNPFAITGSDVYDQFTKGQLDLYDPATKQGALSQAWLTDRVAMLGYVVKRNTDNNTNTLLDGPNVLYRDFYTRTDIRVGSMFVGDDSRIHYVFGAKSGDVLLGGSKDDHLFAGAGNETLKGSTGDDQYFFAGNIGRDTVSDSDYKGAIWIGDAKLPGTAIPFNTSKQANLWVDANGTNYRYDERSHALTISQGSFGTGQVLIQNFDLGKALDTRQGAAGDLGIHLGASDASALRRVSAMPTNPFDDPSFDPDSAVQNSEMKEGGTSTFALYLPDVAADGGQLVRIHLDGDSAGSLKAQIGDQVVTLTDGSFDLTVSEGSKEVTFSLLSEGDISANEQITLSATLLDADGNAMGAAHVDGTLSLDAASETPTGLRDVLGGGDPINFSTSGGTEYHYDDLDNVITQNPGGSHEDTLHGGDQNVHIVGGIGRDSILAGSGTDVIEGNGGQDVIWGGSGNNHIYADNEVSIEDAIDNAAPATGVQGVWIDGGTGDSTIVGSAGNDVLTGNGNDLIIAGNGDNFILGHTDWLATSYDWVVTLVGDHYEFTPADTLTEPNDAVSDTIYAGDGNNYITTGNGDNFVSVGDGNNQIIGGAGDNNILAGDGNNQIFADFTANLPTNTSQDYVEVGDGNNYVQVGQGSSSIVVGTGNDTVNGGDGDDYVEVRGGDGTDFIDVGEGDNTVLGGDGNSSIQGGGGDNYVEAGDGANTIVFTDGDNTIFTGDGNDTVQVGIGANYMEVGDGDVSINGGLAGGGGDDTVFAGDGNDTINLGDGNNYVEVGDGDDLVTVGGGNNTVWLGEGTDAVKAGDGNNEIHAGDGDDIVFAGNGENTLFGGGGDDTLIAGSGENEIHAGSGNTLMLGAGNTTYVLGADDGNSEILHGAIIDGQTILSQGVDTLKFTDGLGPSDLTVTAALSTSGAPSLVIDYGTGSEIIVDNGLSDRIGQITFDDGSSYSPEELVDLAYSVPVTIAGANGNLVFDATDGGSVQAGPGNDSVYAWGSNETVTGGSGGGELFAVGHGDVLVAGDGVDTLSSVHGDTTFVVNSTNTVINAADGTQNNTVLSSVSYSLGNNIQNLTLTGSADLSAGGNSLDNVITANSGNDTLQAGFGNDTLVAGSGNDVLITGFGTTTLELGADIGNDTIQSFFNRPAVLSFGADVSPDDVTFERGSTGDLTLQLAGGGSVLLQGQYHQNTITSIVFADGTTLSAEGIDELPINTPDADGVLRGDGLDDTIVGTAGADTVDGSSGDDLIEGGGGGDTVLFGYGMGSSVVVDSGANTIQLNAGIAFANLAAVQSGNDLVLSLRGTDSSLVLQGYFAPNSGQQWTLATDDGQTEDISAVLADTASRVSSWADDQASSYIAVLEGEFIAEKLREGYHSIGNGQFAQSSTSPFHASWLTSDQTQTNTIHWFPEANTGFSDSTQVQHFHFQNWSPSFGGAISNSTASISVARLDSVNGGFYQTQNDSFFEQSSQQWLSVSWHIDPGSTISSENGGGVSESFILSFDPKYSFLDPHSAGPWAIGISSSGSVFDDTTGTSTGQITGLGSAPSQPPNSTTFNPPSVLGYIFTNFETETLNWITLDNGNDYIQGGDVVQAGAGNDTIVGSGFIQAGSGNDVLRDAAIMLAGTGNADMDGGASSNRYLIAPAYQGTYYIHDSGATGGVTYADEGSDSNKYFDGSAGGDRTHYPTPGDFDVTAIADVYYRSIGLPNWNAPINFSPFDISLDDLEQAIADHLVPPLPYADDYATWLPLYKAAGVPIDTVEFGPGVTLNDLRLSWADDNHTLVLQWGPRGRAEIALPGARDYGYGIEQVKFDQDGSVVGMDQLLALAPPRPPIVGVSDGESVEGTRYDDVLQGGPGQETLNGGLGNDTMIGGSGQDQIEDNSGNNVMIGGSGSATMAAGAGNDTLVAGTGSAFMDGGTGANTYVFNRGFGQVEISNSDESADHTDTLRFGDGITQDDLIVLHDNSNVYLKLAGESGRIRLDNAIYDPFQQPASVQFADGTSWTFDDLISHSAPVFEFDQGSGSQVISSDAYPAFASDMYSGDVTVGHDGVDLLISNGSDQLRITGWYANPASMPQMDALFADGEISASDLTVRSLDIEDGLGGQTLQGIDNFHNLLQNISGAADTLIGGNSADFLRGDGGDDSITSGGGGDFIVGLEGNDVIDVGSTDAVIAFNSGDGQDTLTGFSGGTLSLGGIAVEDIALSRDQSDALIDLGNGDSIRLAGWFDNTSPSAARVQIVGDLIRTYDLGAALSALATPGASLSDYLASTRPDSAFGGVLAYEFATQRNLDFDPATLESVLATPGFGATAQSFPVEGVYDFSPASGDQVIQDGTQYRAVAFAAPSDQASVTHDGVDLIISAAGSTLRIRNWYADPNNVPSLALYFSDGATFDAATLTEQGLVFDGSAGNEALVGVAGFRSTFIAGPGDTLIGGSGGNTFEFGPSSGHNTLIDSALAGTGNSDIVRFGAGVSISDVSFTPQGSDLLIGYGPGDDTILLKGVDLSQSDSTLSFEFVDGGSVNISGDGSGDFEFDYFDAQGDEIGDTLVNADGSFGSDQFNPDGSSSGNFHNSDGTYYTYVRGADGSYSEDDFDATGFKTGDFFSHPDGSQQEDTFNADGTSSGETDNADGSFSTYEQDANGVRETDNYDSFGTFTSYSILTPSADGSTFTNDYDPDGTLIGDSFTHPDGSAGSDQFFADGSSQGERDNPDGSFTTYNNDGVGDLFYDSYDAQGDLIGDHFVNADGSSGEDTFNADGSSSGSYHNTDGTSYTYTRDAAGFYGEDDFDATGFKTGDHFSGPDGSFADDSFNADGSSFGDVHYADGSFSQYTQDSGGVRETDNYDASGNLAGYSIFTPSADGSTVTNDYAPDGTLLDDSFTHADGTSGSDQFFADGSSQGQRNNADGSYSTYFNDGVGDVSSRYYDVQGNQTGDRFAEADGSYGEDTLNLDGSSFGDFHNADGSYSTYTETAGGSLLQYNFSAGGTLTGVIDLITNADGSFIYYDTEYDGNGGYNRSWSTSDGRSGENDLADDGSTLNRTVNADGSSVTSTHSTATGIYGTDYVNADGSFTDYQTLYDGNGGYTQTWTASDGRTGENDLADDGSTFNQTVNADGSSVTSTHSTSTGIYGTDYVNADGGFTDYQTLYDGNGGYDQSWVASDGRHGENDLADDGSTFNQTVNADGSSVTSTHDATTGIYGTNYVNADGSFTDYQTLYDGNGGYAQTWTASDGRHGENDLADDGSTFNQTVNADGSSVTSTHDTASGIYGTDYVNADGSFTNYETSYDGQGGYTQTWASSDGRTGENDLADDGSTFNQTVNADGSSVTSTHDTASGIYGTEYANADGSFTDYQTLYDGSGGYTQTWVASDGRHGENDLADNGSTFNQTVNADGSSVTSTHSTVTGVYGTNYVNADGSFTDYQTLYDGNGGYEQAWVRNDGSAGSVDVDDTGALVGRSSRSAAGFQEVDAGANAMLLGTSAAESLVGPSGNGFLVGGAGDDSLSTGSGSDIVAFDAGDGHDSVDLSQGTNHVLSLGGGIRYSDLTLEKSGGDLVLNAGADDQLLFRNWYAGANNLVTLQVILDTTSDFDAGSSDPLLNQKVQAFDFQGIASQFDDALAQNPGLTNWAITAALSQFHLSGSDDAALGGDLAYGYGHGALSGVAVNAAEGELSAQGFTQDPQQLKSSAQLQQGVAKLT